MPAAETCSDLEESVRQSISAASDAGTSTLVPTGFSCSVASDQACLCDTTLNISPRSATGTYATVGNQLTMTTLAVEPSTDGGIRDAGAGNPLDYCVSGSTFRYRTQHPSNDSTAIVTLTKLIR